VKHPPIGLPPEMIEPLAAGLAAVLVASIRRDQEAAERIRQELEEAARQDAERDDDRSAGDRCVPCTKEGL
jgi:hypothetical protein